MRTRRPYVRIDPDELERIRQIDLLTYLREFEPGNLQKVKGTTANVKHFFTLLGKMFFTPYGKEFFTYLGKQIFTS